MNWRKVAHDLEATEGTGSWSRRVAVKLNRIAGSGSWPRRIAQGQNPDGKPWNRAAADELAKL